MPLFPLPRCHLGFQNNFDLGLQFSQIIVLRVFTYTVCIFLYDVNVLIVWHVYVPRCVQTHDLSLVMTITFTRPFLKHAIRFDVVVLACVISSPSRLICVAALLEHEGAFDVLSDVTCDVTCDVDCDALLDRDVLVERDALLACDTGRLRATDRVGRFVLGHSRPA